MDKQEAERLIEAYADAVYRLAYAARAAGRTRRT